MASCVVSWECDPLWLTAIWFSDTPAWRMYGLMQPSGMTVSRSPVSHQSHIIIIPRGPVDPLFFFLSPQDLPREYYDTRGRFNRRPDVCMQGRLGTRRHLRSAITHSSWSRRSRVSFRDGTGQPDGIRSRFPILVEACRVGRYLKTLNPPGSRSFLKSCPSFSSSPESTLLLVLAFQLR